MKDVGDAYNKGYEFGEKLDLSMQDVGKKLDGIDKSMVNMDNLANNVGGAVTSGKGGGGGSKAIKTTTDDKLLSDEDIQMLLDIATRDYKLNYQQVTPDIAISFGDVRETVDVTQVIDAVGSAVQELINGDGEVKNYG